jgi:hypothetical protein
LKRSSGFDHVCKVGVQLSISTKCFLSFSLSVRVNLTLSSTLIDFR